MKNQVFTIKSIGSVFILTMMIMLAGGSAFATALCGLTISAGTVSGGTAQTVCVGSPTTTLGTSSGTLSSGTSVAYAWTESAHSGISGSTFFPGSFSAASSLNTTYTPNAGTIGTITLKLTATASGTCSGSITSLVVITVNEATLTLNGETATCVWDPMVIEGHFAGVTLPASETINWYNNSAGSGTPIFSETVSIGGISGGTNESALFEHFVPSSAGNYWAQAIDGCSSSVTEFSVYAVAPPTATVNGEICGAGTVTLNATQGAGTAYLAWLNNYDDDGDGTYGSPFTTESLPNTGSGMPALTTTQVIIPYYAYDIFYDASENACYSDTVEVDAILDPIPTVSVSSVAAICQGGTTAALGGSFGGGATAATWDDGGAGGTFSSDNTTGLTPGVTTYTASATSPSPVTLTLTTNGSGVCGPVSTSTSLVVNTTAAITSATYASSPICPSASTTLTANGVAGTGTTVNWYTSPGGIGSSLGSGTSISESPGTYYAYVTGTCGTAQASVTVGSLTNAGITSATSAASPICPGTETTVTANGVVGTSAVVNWWTGSGGSGSNVGSGTSISVGSGTYYADVTGTCGATAEASVTVGSETNVGITSATSAASPICSGTETTVTANGVVGTSAVVNWWTGSGGSGSNVGSGTSISVGSGTYYADVTGTCGAPAEASVTVGSETNVGITSATSAASPICPGTETTVTANGVVGTSAVVNWWTGSGGSGSNVGSGTSISVGSGTYYADVTGTCGAPAEASVTVGSETNVGITSATSAASPICPGTETTVTANGVVGTSAVVNWWTGSGGSGSNVGSGTSISVGSGTYYADVTGTCGATAEASVTVGSETNVGITSATSAASPICPGTETTVTANGVVGTSAVVNWWTGSGGSGSNVGSGTSISVGSGTYYADVTGTCGATAEASVTVGSETNVGITSATSAASPICPGTETTVTANGVVGTSAVVNWWTGSGGSGSNVGSGTSISVGSGTYYADVTGNCGATAEASVTVGSETNVGITSATSAASPICPGTETTVTANGVVGTSAVVNWWTGSGGSGSNVGSGTSISVGSGTYYADVTGTCGATAEASVTVGSETNVGITSATSAASPICPGTETTVTANGVVGTSAVVNWWTGSGGSGSNVGSGTSISVGSGTYYADVTGTCGATAEASVTVGSETNVGITSATSAASPICPGTETTVTANGVVGTSAVVNWWTGSGGSGSNVGSGTSISVVSGTYYADVTGTCGATAEASVTVGSETNVGITSATSGASPICPSGSTALTANGVVGTGATVTWYSGSGASGTSYGTGTSITESPGTYYAYVTGSCGTPAQSSVTVGSETNVGITSATSGTSPICPSGSTALTANGVVGTGATVTWYSGANATGTDYGTGTSITEGPGTYYAYVTGSCGTPAQSSVTVGSNTIAAITSATATASSVCPGATTTITAVGVSGTGASITWWTGTGGTGTNLGSSTSITEGPGTYYAYVTGTCGTAQASATVGTSALPSVSISSSGNLTCTATSATLTASGASTYSWSGGATGSTHSVTAAGTYTVTGTSSAGCTASATYTETLTTTPLATLTVTVVNNCGSSTLTASGMSTGATVTWSPSGSGSPLTVTTAGSYTAIQSLSGCTSSASAAVTASPGSGLTLTPTITNVSCYGGSNGSISVAASGGSGSYTYSWSGSSCGGGSSSASITGKPAGTYTVTVTNGECHATGVYTITQPSAALAVTGTVTNVTCNGGDNGSISTTVTGGTASYTYLWSPGGATTSGISGKDAGTYDVTVTDAHGCTASGSYTITQPGAISCSITVTPSTTCYTGGVPTNFYLGYGPQSATCSATCSASGCTYNWSGSTGTSCFSNSHISNPVYSCSYAGTYTYTCTATNTSGCSTTQTVTVCVVDCQDHSHSGNILVCHGSGCTPTTVSCASSGVPGYIAPSYCPSNHLGAVGSGCSETGGRESGEENGTAVINELTVNAYPNPFNSELNVKIQSNLTDNVDVTVYDVTGRTMETKPAQSAESVITVGQNLTAGVYFIEVSQGGVVKKVKVVKY